jgi:hypothetical protein
MFERGRVLRGGYAPSPFKFPSPAMNSLVCPINRLERGKG